MTPAQFNFLDVGQIIYEEKVGSTLHWTVIEVGDGWIDAQCGWAERRIERSECQGYSLRVAAY